MVNADSIRRDLLDARRGYCVIRGFYEAARVKNYLHRCKQFMANAPQIYRRITTDEMYDYVHPRSHDAADRTLRLYQFLHNHRGDFEGAFFQQAINLREEIERVWDKNLEYRAERLRLLSFVIVTRYLNATGMLPRHRDYEGCLQYPLLQMLVLITKPGVDFKGGEFILYTRSGERISTSDLNLMPGDLLVFDKSLEHEVTGVEEGEKHGTGRWTVLIGVRAPRHSRIEVIVKKCLGAAAWRRKFRV